jgi:hypothetical protein
MMARWSFVCQRQSRGAFERAPEYLGCRGYLRDAWRLSRDLWRVRFALPELQWQENRRIAVPQGKLPYTRLCRQADPQSGNSSGMQSGQNASFGLLPGGAGFWTSVVLVQARFDDRFFLFAKFPVIEPRIIPTRMEITRGPHWRGADKNKLTSQVQSPKLRNIPSRVAEGLALRCHGNRFRESGTTRCQFQVRRVFEQRWRERRLCSSRDSWWDEPIDRPALIYG